MNGPNAWNIVPSNPWFEVSTGTVEFVVFQSRLEAIGRWLETVAQALEQTLMEEENELNRAIADDSSEWSYEIQMVHQEDLGWSQVVMPMLAFGSTITAVFAATEMLMDDLVALAQTPDTGSFKSFDVARSGSKIERQRAFLEIRAGWKMDWDDRERQQFELLQKVRNKTAHALGEGLPSGVLRDLAEIMEWTNGEFRWEPRLVEAALYAVGHFAKVMEDAKESRDRDHDDHHRNP